jgi:hypothetical protein
MVSLVDIGPSKGTVTVRGQNVEVNGLTATHIVGILMAFPEVRKILAEREADLQLLISQFPLAVAMILAAGTGKESDDATIQVALTLGVGEQYELLAKIVELTFPKGLKSFLDGVNAAMDSVGVRGWDQAMKSPVQSSPVSEPDEQSKTAGTAPPANSVPGANLSDVTS